MNGADIVTVSNATLDLAPNGTGTVVVRGNTNSGAIVFNCESNTHGQKVFGQPHSASVTNTLMLPAGADSTLVSLVSADTLTNKILTAPKIADGGFIADANGNELVVFQTTGSAVNQLEITNNAAGSDPILAATGGDTNIGIVLTPKGTGEIVIAAGNLNYGGDSVTSTGAELNALDGITAVVGELNALDIGSTAVGTAVASKAVILDSNKDYTGIRNFTVSGELDAATGDFSGAVDIAGDLTLSAGADGALTFGVASSVKVIDNNAAALVFEEADNAYMTFVTTNSSEAVKFDKALDINAAVQIDATVTVGVNDTGYDVKFFGDAASAFMIWDASADDLILSGGAGLIVPDGQFTLGSTAVTSTAAELNLVDGITAGTVIASKAIITDSNIDITGGRNITISGELDAATGDFSGDVDVAGSLTIAGLSIKVSGKETIYIPSGAMYPSTTNPCSDLTQVETTALRPDLKVLDFATGSDEFAQFSIAFPKSWNEGTVTFQPFWTVTGTNTGTVAWGLSGVSVSNDGSINTAFGTTVVCTALAHSGTSNDLMRSVESGAVTIAGSPAADDMCFFQVSRDVSADNQSGDARLLGIKVFFTTNAENDA